VGGVTTRGERQDHKYYPGHRMAEMFPTRMRYSGVSLAGASVVTVIAALFMRETDGIDLRNLDEADREELARSGVV
jgi:hypothetical protein